MGMATGISRAIIDKTLLGLFVVLFAMFIIPRYPLQLWQVWLVFTVTSVIIGMAVWFLTLFWDSNLNLVRNILDHLLTGFIFAAMLVVIMPLYGFNIEQQWVAYTGVGIVVSIAVWIIVPGERNAAGKKGSAGSRHGGK